MQGSLHVGLTAAERRRGGVVEAMEAGSELSDEE
jgi:hypothetical protein